ncbi:MAG: lipoprotein [Pseudomonadota bacterium]
MHVTVTKKLIVVLALSLLVAACGRKGPLAAPSASTGTATDQQQTPDAPTEDKPFVLDPLL